MTPATVVGTILLVLPALALTAHLRPLPHLEDRVVVLTAEDLETLDNANQGLTGLFQGDEMLDAEQLAFEEGKSDVDRTWIQNTRYRWPKGVVPYRFKDSFSAAEQKKVTDALAELNTKSGGCVSFVQRTNEANYVEITAGGGCWSMVGRSRGAQPLNLQKDGCMSTGIIQHEFLHALGVYHEQSRADRDSYITVVWDNIIPSKKNQ